jgi:hypothetical protein
MSTPKSDPAFPPVITINGRNYVQRGALEQYKAELVRRSLGGRSPPPPPPRPDVDVLVTFKTVSAELGVGRRTIGRWLKETTNAAADSAAA